jgi:hypothetical protein
VTDRLPLFRRTVTGLVPENDYARQKIQGVKIGATVAVGVSRPRNLDHLRLYWLLVDTIAEAIGAESENVSDVIKLRVGHVRTVQTKTGLQHFPKSISFAALDQAEFSAFFDKACAAVCAEFVPHLKTGELRQQIEDLAGANYHAPNPRPHKPAKREFTKD